MSGLDFVSTDMSDESLSNLISNIEYWRGVRDVTKSVAVFSMFRDNELVRADTVVGSDYEGRYLTYFTDDGWEMELLNGNTALDVYTVANTLIQRSGDFHHVFVEGIKNVGGDLFLETGS